MAQGVLEGPRFSWHFGTTRVVGHQPNALAAFTPGEIPGTHFQWLSRTLGTWYNIEGKKSSPVTGLEWPRGFQQVKVLRFHKKGKGRWRRLYPQKKFLVFISVRGLVEPRATVRPERSCHWKFPMTPLGIEQATCQFVAQCLNHYATTSPHNIQIIL